MGATSASITHSKAGFGLIVVLLLVGVGCGVAITTKIASEFLQKREILYRKRHSFK